MKEVCIYSTTFTEFVAFVVAVVQHFRSSWFLICSTLALVSTRVLFACLGVVQLDLEVS
jgi:hypothetical protein